VKGVSSLEVKTTEAISTENTHFVMGAVNVICAGAASITEVVKLQTISISQV
jgi:hypothetical protein